jgi:hypothetical protein
MYIYSSSRKQENQALMDGVVSGDPSSMTQIHNITQTAKRLRGRKKERKRKSKVRNRRRKSMKDKISKAERGRKSQY